MVKNSPFWNYYCDDMNSRILPNFIFHVKKNMKIDPKTTNSTDLEVKMTITEAFVISNVLIFYFYQTVVRKINMGNYA